MSSSFLTSSNQTMADLCLFSRCGKLFIEPLQALLRHGFSHAASGLAGASVDKTQRVVNTQQNRTNIMVFYYLHLQYYY